MILRTERLGLLACTVTMFFIGCDKTSPEPAPAAGTNVAELSPAVPSTPAQSERPKPASDEDPGITWKDPPGWTRLSQKKPMRVATYRIGGEAPGAEDAELAVFYFGPNSGGGVDANITRWRKQFPDVPDAEVRRSERSQNNLTQHIVEIEKGTFSSGMPMGPQTPQKDYGLLAAIVEGPGGHTFFKLTGPAKTVKDARANFMALLDSVQSASR